MVTPDTPPCYSFEHQSQFPQCHPRQSDGGKEWETSVQSSIWLIQVRYANCWLSKDSSKIKTCLPPFLQCHSLFSESLNIFSEHCLFWVVGGCIFKTVFIFSSFFPTLIAFSPVFCASLPLFADCLMWVKHRSSWENDRLGNVYLSVKSNHNICPDLDMAPPREQ